MNTIFTLLKDNDPIANGSFIVPPELGTSCFGTYREAEAILDEKHRIKTGMFEGVIFDHVNVTKNLGS